MVKEQGGVTQINDEDFYTCIFACFLSQEEPKRVHQTLKDPSWIEAMQEELLQFKMQKEEGIDYEEVFAPVARIKAIRLFLAYASFIGFMVYQMESAFVYGTIEEEVYVCQPPGFEDPDYPDKVYKVVKALYGLHQALRAWYETFANYLLENGFQRGKIDQTLFIKKQRGDILLKQDGIFISQDKYVAKILRKFGLTNGKSANTPIDTKKSLLKDPDGEDVDVHTYKSMIGSLMYLTSSRSDIMFSICACSRFQVTPNASYLHAVKRIFRYLKGKPHLGSWYPKYSSFNLVAYSDSNYARASLDRKSTIGGFQFLGCILISWQCKKQTIVATSSTKAEYVAVASCCAQVLWIQNQLLDYGNEALAILRQMKTGKENSNPLMADSLPKTILLTFIHGIRINMAIINVVRLKLMLFGLMIDAAHLMLLGHKKSNDVVRLQALIDRKKVIITEDSIRQALQLDDAGSVDCLPNEEFFADLARMGYEKPSTNLVRNVDSLSKFLMYLRFLQLMINAQAAQNVEDATEDEDAISEVSAEPTSPLPTPATLPPPPQPEHIPSPPQAKTAQPSPPL
nr:hypothetical protein [Tanacetum cinerariifolium]